MTLKERIKQLIQELNKDVFEKEEVTKLAFLSAIVGESIFLLGAPGVAKSLIARRLKFAFQGGNSFEYLMNKFSTPDEIFGPVSITQLKEDKYVRLTDKYLPNAQIVFLDEIWKAGASIQNSLLTILNEKKYRNGEQEIDADIRGLIAASNELPETGQGLEALWDRFLVRYIVEGITDKDNFNKMISENLKSYQDNIPTELKITETEYKAWDAQINAVDIPEEVFKIIHFIRTKVQESNENRENPIYISDRRWRKIVRLLRGSAFLNGREKVDLMDCFLISYCIWDEKEQLEEVKNIVSDILRYNGYSLSFPLIPTQGQINEFDKEVKNETNVIREIDTEYFTLYNNDYYKVIGLEKHFSNSNSNSNYIQKEDFDNLKQKESSIYLHNQRLHHSNTIFVDKHSNTGELVIYQINYNSRKGELLGTFKVETHTKTDKKKEIQKPNKRLKKIWDDDSEKIIQSIQSQIEDVENYRQTHLNQLHTNLFVDSSLAYLVESNLHERIQNLQQMQIEVEKIKHYYDSLT